LLLLLDEFSVVSELLLELFTFLIEICCFFLELFVRVELMESHFILVLGFGFFEMVFVGFGEVKHLLDGLVGLLKVGFFLL